MSERANIVGNVYDKYETKNPIARRLMAGFLGAVTELYRRVAPQTVLEVGCGEGRLADHLVRVGGRPREFRAVDLSLDRVRPDVDPAIAFSTASVYSLPYEARRFELVLCCEVLEHLERPVDAIAELARVAERAVLLSAPWEPVWRVLNMARGRYWADFGNTPGHIQHFGRRELVRLARTRLSVVALRAPLPWTVLLGEPLR